MRSCEDIKFRGAQYFDFLWKLGWKTHVRQDVTQKRPAFFGVWELKMKGSPLARLLWNYAVCACGESEKRTDFMFSMQSWEYAQLSRMTIETCLWLITNEMLGHTDACCLSLRLLACWLIICCVSFSKFRVQKSVRGSSSFTLFSSSVTAYWSFLTREQWVWIFVFARAGDQVYFTTLDKVDECKNSLTKVKLQL